MYVSLSRLRIDPDRAPDLVCAFRGRARLVDDFEGFVDLQVWQSDRDPGELVMGFALAVARALHAVHAQPRAPGVTRADRSRSRRRDQARAARAPAPYDVVAE